MSLPWKPLPIKEILYHAAVEKRPVLLRYIAANGQKKEIVLTSVSTSSKIEVRQEFDTFDLSTITEIRIINTCGQESRLKGHEELRLLIVDEPWMDCCDARVL